MFCGIHLFCVLNTRKRVAPCSIQLIMTNHETKKICIALCGRKGESSMPCIEAYKEHIMYTIDGYSNFLFLNRDGCPKTNVNYATMFRGLAKKYNKCHEEALPKVMTPHTLRHTFCTNLANAGMNPKALQYIMGHSNITMTLNYYAHATFASARAEMERLIAA